MNENKLTYKDIEEYESLFALAPSFLLERFVRKNANLVLKFRSVVQSYFLNLTEEQKSKLDLILNSEIEELQGLMLEAYDKTHNKQFKILGDSNNREFIKINLDELRDLIMDDQ